jgi:hypothetical protein
MTKDVFKRLPQRRHLCESGVAFGCSLHNGGSIYSGLLNKRSLEPISFGEQVGVMVDRHS